MAVAVPPGLTGWPTLVESILKASASGPEPVAEAALAAVHQVVKVDWAAIVRWKSDGPQVVFSSGTAIELPPHRLREGSVSLCGHAAGVVAIDQSTDLVAARTSSAAELDLDDLRALRALALLATQAADPSRAAFTALYSVATKLLASRDLEEVLLAVANATAQVLHAEIGGIFLVDASGRFLEMRSVVGHHTVDTARLRVKPGQGLAGKVFELGVVHRVDDWTTDPSITKEFLTIASEEGTQSALGAPMKVRDRTIGVLCAWRRRRSVFTDADIQVMTLLAELATVAVEKARIRQAERDGAQRLRDSNQQLEQRYQEAERALRVHQQLTQIAVEGSEMGEVVRSLRSLTGGSAVLIDEDDRVLASDQGGDESLTELVRSWRRTRSRRLDRPSELLEPPDGGGRWTVVVPVRAAGLEWGYLAMGLDSPPSRGDTVAAEQAATVCALLLAREEAAVSATRRLEGEFVWDLLEGRVRDEAEALVRARQLQRDLPRPARVLLVRVDGWERLVRSEQWTPEQLERARGRGAQALSERLAARNAAARVIARRANLFVVLAPQPRDAAAEWARHLGELAVAAVSSSDLHAVAGVSGVVESVLGFPEGFRQARFALSAASLPQQPVVVFEALGVLQFLLTPAEGPDLERFVEQTIGGLLAYDRAHRTSLVPTLEAYLACDCNLQRAAERLFVHHKTMRYRLQRIHALSGLRLDRQDDRFNAQLALKIMGLLTRSPSTAAVSAHQLPE
jgi:sugar diacid utilization regulator/GAF domain-containing protein